MLPLRVALTRPNTRSRQSWGLFGISSMASAQSSNSGTVHMYLARSCSSVRVGGWVTSPAPINRAKSALFGSNTSRIMDFQAGVPPRTFPKTITSVRLCDVGIDAAVAVSTDTGSWGVVDPTSAVVRGLAAVVAMARSLASLSSSEAPF